MYSVLSTFCHVMSEQLPQPAISIWCASSACTHSGCEVEVRIIASFGRIVGNTEVWDRKVNKTIEPLRYPVALHAHHGLVAMEATNHEAEAEPPNQSAQESFTTPRPRTRQNGGPE